MPSLPSPPPAAPIARAKRFVGEVIGQLREREALLLEQRLLAVVIGKAEAVPQDERAAMQALQATNAQRLAELERRKLNRFLFALRRALIGLPAPVGRPLRGLVRLALRVPARAKAPGPTPAMALPLAELPPPSLREPVGVVMHVYYPELAPELSAYLQNIPGPADLYVSTDTDAKAERLRQTFAAWDRGAVEVRAAPNRGRDIAPKLIAFREVYDRHAVVLHLHSKKSPHDSVLRLWRYFLLETLVGDRAAIASILAAFEALPDLGMVGPDHYFAVRNGIDWGGNFDLAQGLAQRFGATLDPAAPIDFPSGSMFWARSAALRPLLDLDLRPEDFPPEERQTDGTLAHAVERLYFKVCEAAGYRWIKVRRADLADAG